MRRAFTLIELLVVIAIIGLMVSVAVVNVRAGQASARIKGATRDVFAAIRQARSVALVTGKPAIITYSTVREDDEPTARIEIDSAKMFDMSVDRSKVQTLTGEPLADAGYELVHIEDGTSGGRRSAKSSRTSSGRTAARKPEPAVGEEGEAGEGGGGETLEDALFAPIDTSIVKGICIKVQMEEDVESAEGPRPSNKISVFSNVDFLLGQFKAERAKAEKREEKAAGEAKDGGDKKAAADEDQEPVSVVWETNGRVEPHRVWVYADGKRPEDGLMIKVDRFGAAKVLAGDGREDD